MNIRECVKVRHSVRAYEDRPIDAKAAEDLKVTLPAASSIASCSASRMACGISSDAA